jgi:hypothetical protein
MLNIEWARIVAAERLRETEENVRQGRFRRAIAERNATSAEPSAAGRGATAEPCRDAGQRAKPALG